jgi:hypothetical protein
MNIQTSVRLLCGLILLTTLSSQAQEKAKSAEEAARELANPNTPLATLNFKLQFHGFEGSLPGANRQN